MTLYDIQSGVVLEDAHEARVAEFVRVEENQLDLDAIYAEYRRLLNDIRARNVIPEGPSC